MQTSIHPDYFEKATITCACGVVRTVGSTREAISLELCSACHPFYTGKQKLVDTAGRVELFKARFAKQESTAKERKTKRVKNEVRKDAKAATEAPSVPEEKEA